MSITTKTAFDFPQALNYQKYVIGTGGFIAGGCFKNIFNGEKAKDIDIFFRTEEDYHSGKRVYDENDEYKVIYKNKNATGYIESKTGVKIDLVKSQFKSPIDTIKDFDFTITKFVLYSEITGEDEDGEPEWETKASYTSDFFEHLTLKRLVVDDKMKFPLSTFNRMTRYIGYGYNPCRDTKEKIVRALNDEKLPSGSEGLFKGFYDGVD